MSRTTRRIISLGVLSLSILFLSGCATVPTPKSEQRLELRKEETKLKNNFKFVSFDREIISPENDTDSYFKIFIDKKYRGESNILLRSQKKFYETILSEDRHLLRIEKWIYNEKEKSWKKDIDARQPDYLYFDIQKEKLTVVTLEYTKDGAAHQFLISFEHLQQQR